MSFNGCCFFEEACANHSPRDAPLIWRAALEGVDIEFPTPWFDMRRVCMHNRQPDAAQDRPMIVLVHDEPNGSAELTQALREEGFAVEQAGDLRDAASCAAQCAPDLVILAMARQALDEQALTRVRNIPALRSVPLVVVRGRSTWSAQDLDTFMAHVWRTFSAHVLSKP
jgi:CheY-like chemotaxis protein